MKKTIAMVFALAVMLCVLALPVSAADEVESRVYLDAPAQALAGDAVGVALYVNGNTAAGGVQGTVTYDAEQLEYTGVTLRDDVTALGNTEDVTIKADGTGVINFVTLSNVADGNAPADAWLTLNFTVKMTAAGDAAAVALSDVVVSDKAGVSRLNVTTLDTAVTVIAIGENDCVDMDGATIRTDLTNQGIRFQATPDSETVDLSAITEVGVVMMPKKLLYDGQDLTKETIGKGGTTPAIGSITAEEKLAAVQGGEAVYATLTNGTTEGRANVEIVARAYVVVKVDVDKYVTIYSHNDIDDKAVVTGEATKTLVGVAQSIAAKQIANGATDTLGELLTKTDVLENDEVTTLLTFCRDNYSYL